MPHERVRVRFAPSPTGFLHIGGLRTALYNELFARHGRGDFILRIEDTDRERIVPGAIESICASLKKSGVVPNEGIWIDEQGKIIECGTHGPYLQSKRKERHREYAQTLIEMGKAYPCFCEEERLQALRKKQQNEKRPPGYDGSCRDIPAGDAAKRISNGEAHTVRLKFPETGSVVIQDYLRGKVAFDWGTIDDQIIIKSDGMPTYHLASTCDDHDMAITHVLRGEEWVPSTPKHVFIYEAFGWDIPIFAHLPLILNPDKSKLSKRQGDVAVDDYLEKGYLPEALINFVALLGWNPKSDREIYSHDELIRLFDLKKVNKAGAVFSIDKLNWMNSGYIRELPTKTYLEKTLPYLVASDSDLEFLKRAACLVKDRVHTIPSVVQETAFLFAAGYDFSETPLGWKEQDAESVRERLQAVSKRIQKMQEKKSFDPAHVETELMALIKEREWGNGDTLWPLRVALSGKKHSPGPFELVATYGKERAIRRIDAALDTL